MARNIAGRWLLDLGERTVQSIPLAGSVYKTLQQLLQTVFQDSKTRFRRVILVEYPRRGLWAIAFVTGTMTAAAASTPNMFEHFYSYHAQPHQWLVRGGGGVVPESDVINLSISIEDAFKVLLSGGIVGPNLASEVPPRTHHSGRRRKSSGSDLLKPAQPEPDRNKPSSCRSSPWMTNARPRLGRGRFALALQSVMISVLLRSGQ